MIFKQLNITGPDAQKFLQGQVTCDVKKIAPGDHSWGAHCNLKGRIIANFKLHCESTETYNLALPESMIKVLQTSLQKYAVFSKVDLSITDKSIEQSTLELIQQRVAIILPETQEKFTPQAIGFEKIGGVSFDKGCYTGQEIIARMHYRGKLKDGLYCGEMPANTALVPNTPLQDGDGRILGYALLSTIADNEQCIFLANCRHEQPKPDSVFINHTPINNLNI